MLRTIALIGLAVALAVLPDAALAQQGTSSSYGSVGWGACDPYAGAHAQRPRLEGQVPG